MDIYEYEERFVKRQNLKGAKNLLRLIVMAVGVLIATCLILVTLQLWSINQYAGIVGAVASVLIFVACYVLPVVRIGKMEAFAINVTPKTARAAQKHNRRLRYSIAEKMVDVTDKVEAIGWYDEMEIGRLAVALHNKNDEGVKASLTALYQQSVKASAKEIIFRSALKSGSYSALSQNNRIDATLVAVVNLQMIKDLVFLYGFRPSEGRLLKIFAQVLQNSLIAYGLGSAKIGNGVAKTLGDMTKGIPLLGSAISVIVDSSVHGLTNGTLTAVIGYQTIRYLTTEYKLQDLLDGIDVSETTAELESTCQEIEQQMRQTKKMTA